jgi:hypothetical protein
MALASLNEVEDALGEALDNGYVTHEEIQLALNFKTLPFVAASRFRNSIKDRPDAPDAPSAPIQTFPP